MIQHRYRLIGLACLTHDLLLTATAFLVAFYLRTRTLPSLVSADLPKLYPLRTYIPFLLLILLCWSGVGYVLGIYRKGEPRNPPQVLWDQIRLASAGVIVFEAALYILRADLSRSLVLIFYVTSLVMVVSGRFILFYAKGPLRELFGRYHYVLIVGTGTRALEMAKSIEDAEVLGLRLLGFVSSQPGSQTIEADFRRPYRVIPLEEAGAFLHAHVVDEVLVSADKDDLDRLEPLLLDCEREGVRTRIHLNFLPPLTSRVTLTHLNDLPLITVSTTPPDGAQLIAKRLADIILAMISLVVLSPLLIVIWALIRVTSRGPALYRQTRSGFAGRSFTLYKFRSMYQGADALRASLGHLNEADGPVFKIANDPRCTPIGRWLRRTSLDELPQLWNILKGDMSFVGPRPPLPEEVLQYKSWQRRRLRMKPGLTCLWVLEGRSNVSFERWMELDMSYIDQWSLLLDAEILLKTVPRVLFGRGAS